MKLLISIGINLLVFFSNSANDVQSFQEFSFLNLKESSNGALRRKDARIAVNECSMETLNIILMKDQVLKLELSSYYCYLKNLTKAVESCKRRCRISRSIGRCRGIEERLATVRQKYERLKGERAKWTNYLIFCIRCRALTEYKLIQSRGGIAKRGRIGGNESEDDPAYTLVHLFSSFVTKDISNYELSYLLTKMNVYNSVKEKMCKQKSRALCKCARNSLKELLNNESSLKTIIHNQDAYQRRWFTFNTNGENTIPSSGEPINSIQSECSSVLEMDAQVQNEAEGVTNAGFSREESSQVSTL
ncbi:uncharacterized protein cubi_00978 [Cryptosporidium ubiquitum]|uniref:Uncharacterized protein n=1 Tax=Cryptosporidium ubiquitum TaxID=857276 RepID=A0A1J4M9D8_9CRYT|nr:uncharacterized protein cubi_00978 [Cryptosporidium ubiquitum]OII70833.1 hypothetical protein cubi_00978 [Cryptosporidium ubiquitum]